MLGSFAPAEALRRFEAIAPALGPEEVAAQVAVRWGLAADLFPLPTFRAACPQCRGSRVQIRSIGYGRQTGSPRAARADVSFKCCSCSAVWTHGVPVSDEVYDRATAGHGPVWRWREIRDVIEVAANAEPEREPEP